MQKPSFYNQIHKKLALLYGNDFQDMREIWKQVRRDYRRECGARLPKSLKKNLDEFALLEEWVDTKIVEAGQEDIYYLNKQDLKERGWNEKIIERLYPNPTYRIYLGRGRWAYYYNGTRASELEDSEEFIEYIDRKAKRKSGQKKKAGQFGNEFIL